MIRLSLLSVGWILIYPLTLLNMILEGEKQDYGHTDVVQTHGTAFCPPSHYYPEAIKQIQKVVSLIFCSVPMDSS